MAKAHRLNSWFFAAIACFGLTALYAATAILFQKKIAVRLPPEGFLVGVFLFVLLSNTGAIRDGRYFRGISRETDPVLFWLQAFLGSLFAAAIAALLIYQLLK